jgi:hypothetical protein
MNMRVRKTATAAFVVASVVALWVIAGRTNRTASKFPGTDILPERPSAAGDVFAGWEEALTLRPEQAEQLHDDEGGMDSVRYEPPRVDDQPPEPEDAGGVFKGWEAHYELPAEPQSRRVEVAGIHLGQILQERDDARMEHDLLPEPQLAPEKVLPRWRLLGGMLGAAEEGIGGFYRAQTAGEKSHLNLPFGAGVDISPGEKIQNTFSRLLYGQKYNSAGEFKSEVMQGVVESFRFKLKIDF